MESCFALAFYITCPRTLPSRLDAEPLLPDGVSESDHEGFALKGGMSWCPRGAQRTWRALAGSGLSAELPFLQPV